MTINVGIKKEQKEQIGLMIKDDLFNTTNEFVQKAVDMLISQEISKIKDPKESDLTNILNKIGDFLDEILEDELAEKINITPTILKYIRKISEELSQLKYDLKYKNKRENLISAIMIKENLNRLSIHLENEIEEKEDVTDYVLKIQALKKKLAKSVKYTKE